MSYLTVEKREVERKGIWKCKGNMYADYADVYVKVGIHIHMTPEIILILYKILVGCNENIYLHAFLCELEKLYK